MKRYTIQIDPEPELFDGNDTYYWHIIDNNKIDAGSGWADSIEEAAKDAKDYYNKHIKDISLIDISTKDSYVIKNRISGIANSVDLSIVEKIRELRKLSGRSMLACKDALMKNNKDFNKALEYLKDNQDWKIIKSIQRVD
jgi:hypothetical protein